jgi:hypothetical protein
LTKKRPDNSFTTRLKALPVLLLSLLPYFMRLQEHEAVGSDLVKYKDMSAAYFYRFLRHPWEMLVNPRGF